MWRMRVTTPSVGPLAINQKVHGNSLTRDYRSTAPQIGPDQVVSHASLARHGRVAGCPSPDARYIAV